MKNFACLFPHRNLMSYETILQNRRLFLYKGVKLSLSRRVADLYNLGYGIGKRLRPLLELTALMRFISGFKGASSFWVEQSREAYGK